jgi:hypothetical protein
MATLKILVELTIDDANVKLNAASLDEIKTKVEHLITNSDPNPNRQGSELGRYLHTLGCFHDCEVVEIKKKKAYNVRQ